MLSFITNIVAILIVGFFVWRRGRDRQVASFPPAQWLRIAGVIILGLPAAVYLFFGFAEMGGGGIGGLAHLLPVVTIVLFGFLAWMRPLAGGLALFLAGCVAGFVTLVSMITLSPVPESAVLSSGVLVSALPQMISGVLFFLAGRLAHTAAVRST